MPVDPSLILWHVIVRNGEAAREESKGVKGEVGGSYVSGVKRTVNKSKNDIFMRTLNLVIGYLRYFFEILFFFCLYH